MIKRDGMFPIDFSCFLEAGLVLGIARLALPPLIGIQGTYAVVASLGVVCIIVFCLNIGRRKPVELHIKEEEHHPPTEGLADNPEWTKQLTYELIIPGTDAVVGTVTVVGDTMADVFNQLQSTMTRDYPGSPMQLRSKELVVWHKDTPDKKWILPQNSKRSFTSN
jgi:hypothetical protein